MSEHTKDSVRELFLKQESAHSKGEQCTKNCICELSNAFVSANELEELYQTLKAECPFSYK
jgi:hypothetical protein